MPVFPRWSILVTKNANSTFPSRIWILIVFTCWSVVHNIAKHFNQQGLCVHLVWSAVKKRGFVLLSHDVLIVSQIIIKWRNSAFRHGCFVKGSRQEEEEWLTKESTRSTLVNFDPMELLFVCVYLAFLPFFMIFNNSALSLLMFRCLYCCYLVRRLCCSSLLSRISYCIW